MSVCRLVCPLVCYGAYDVGEIQQFRPLNIFQINKKKSVQNFSHVLREENVLVSLF